MPLKESEAIVLRTYPLGEADRLVSFLSRSSGRMRGVARGARRPKSRFGAALEPLSYIRISYYERETRELVRISQCELIRSFLEAQRDYPTSLGLALVSEITEAVLPEHEPSDAAFRLVLLVAGTIEHRIPLPLPLAYFNLWTVRLGGWLPPMDHCSRCGNEFGTGSAHGSALQTGLLCGNCRRPGMRVLSAAALTLARRMLTEKLERLTEEDWPPAAAKELNNYLLDLIEHHIERELTTRRMLETTGEPQA